MAKRSLDCQIESLLIALGLYSSAKKHNWNIPKKIEIIKSVVIIAPRVLTKINRVRNIMEHEIIRPYEEQVSDFIDIVTLFNACTDKYLLDFPCDSSIANEENDFWYNVEFMYPQKYVEIKIIHIQKDTDNENNQFRYE